MADAARQAAASAAPDLARGARRVGYVMANHPQLFATFIAGEILALEARGVEVVPFAMNSPSPSDLPGERERAERDRTLYLKAQGPARVLLALLRAAAASPLGLMRTARLALGTAGLDLKAMLWRCFHLGEALLVWDRCRAAGVRHLHAQFGLTPATIAWFAADFGNRADGGGWSFSFTIHGFQDFVNEREAALAPKAAAAHHVVCVSDFTRSQLMRLTPPHLWGRFHVVRCGLDLPRFAFTPAPRPPGPPVILTVGRLSHEKGHGVLLEALASLRRAGVEAVVEFAGDGPIRGELEALAARLGVADRVRFLGGLPPAEIPGCLRRAAVFCLPSFSEGLPVSIMEAMAVGTPVVSTWISGIPELAVHGETALLVPPGDAAALAEALGRVLDDGALRERLAQAARRRVVRQHDLAANVGALEALLDATAAAAPGAAAAPAAPSQPAPQGATAG